MKRLSFVAAVFLVSCGSGTSTPLPSKPKPFQLSVQADLSDSVDMVLEECAYRLGDARCRPENVVLVISHGNIGQEVSRCIQKGRVISVSVPSHTVNNVKEKQAIANGIAKCMLGAKSVDSEPDLANSTFKNYVAIDRDFNLLLVKLFERL